MDLYNYFSTMKSGSLLMDLYNYFSTMKSGSLLMDCSTIDTSIAQTMAAIATEKGAMFVDAPVSGGKSYRTLLVHIAGVNMKWFYLFLYSVALVYLSHPPFDFYSTSLC